MATGTIRVLVVLGALWGPAGCMVGPQDDFPDTPVPGVRDDGYPDSGELGADNAGAGVDGDADPDTEAPADGADGLPDDGAFEAGDRDTKDDEDDGLLDEGAVGPRHLIPPPEPPVHIGPPGFVSAERSDDAAPPSPDAAEDPDSAVNDSE